jgi:polyisoprenoid-binding protein YceI
VRGRLAVTLSALFFAGALSAAEMTGWSSVPADSSLEFSGRYEDIELSGTFRDFTVRLEFGNDNQPGLLRVLVNTDSVEMNDSDINEELRKPDWFNTSGNGRASFESASIENSGNGKFIARGMLELKGNSHPVSVPFEWQQEGAVASLKGELGLPRLQWNIGVGEWADTSLIADEVGVRFRVLLARID